MHCCYAREGPAYGRTSTRSLVADIFFDGTGTYGAELRSLYIALKHLQLPVEVMIEGDCDATAGKLK